jgi:Sulfotransferase family
VFKTGGTSFNLSYLPAAFLAEETFVLRGSREPNREDLRRALTFSNEQRSQLKMIAGHNTGELRSSYPNARFLSLARDPVARSISAYLHCKHHEDSWELTGRKMEENNMSLAEFVEANWFDKAHNFQTRLLLGAEVASDPAPKSDAEITAAIRSRFHLIGYTEALELFLFYLHVTDGFPLVLFNKRLVRKEASTFQPTEEDLKVIEHYNRLDREFYRCARNEFDRKVAEVRTKETARLYGKYLEALELYRRTTQGNQYATPLRWREGAG